MNELDLIADESLKFDAILRDRKEYLGVWESRLWHDGDHTIKNFFDVNFGVRTQHGSVYKFVLILYHLWNNTYKKGKDLGFFVKLIPHTPDSEKMKSLVTVNEEIFINGQKLDKAHGDFGSFVDYYESDRSLPSPCEVEVKIKIFHGKNKMSYLERIFTGNSLDYKVSAVF